MGTRSGNGEEYKSFASIAASNVTSGQAQVQRLIFFAFYYGRGIPTKVQQLLQYFSGESVRCNSEVSGYWQGASKL